MIVLLQELCRKSGKNIIKGRKNIGFGIFRGAAVANDFLFSLEMEQLIKEMVYLYNEQPEKMNRCKGPYFGRVRIGKCSGCGFAGDKRRKNLQIKDTGFINFIAKNLCMKNHTQPA